MLWFQAAIGAFFMVMAFKATHLRGALAYSSPGVSLPKRAVARVIFFVIGALLVLDAVARFRG